MFIYTGHRRKDLPAWPLCIDSQSITNIHRDIETKQNKYHTTHHTLPTSNLNSKIRSKSRSQFHLPIASHTITPFQSNPIHKFAIARNRLFQSIQQLIQEVGDLSLNPQNPPSKTPKLGSAQGNKHGRMFRNTCAHRIIGPDTQIE